MNELAKYLRAMLALSVWSAQQTAERSGVAGPKVELLLADSGFAIKEIGELLGKTPGAVAKAVTRARAARRGAQVDEQGISAEAHINDSAE